MDPRITGRGNDRLARPQHWKDPGSGMSWHHIIPYAVLRDVYNLLCSAHIGTQLPEARVALQQHLVLCGYRQDDLNSLLDRMRLENKTQCHPSRRPALLPLEEPDRIALQTPAVWPDWNVFAGPSNRADDPKDRRSGGLTAQFDRLRKGISSADSARLRAIETLFTEMLALLAAGASYLRAYANAARAARQILRDFQPIPYSADMWTQDSGELPRLRRS